ncbi:MAG TPA: hypothetical protein VI588_04425, partial [Candidatus Gracilibacteria bacterium]|nr:hypothetical protein [Candidatus Gracilibacteria bacterium]
MGERLGFPGHTGDDNTPPPVEVRLDGADLDVDTQDLAAPRVETGSSGNTGRLGYLRNMLGVALIAATGASCGTESDTSRAEQGGGAAESVETVSQNAQMELIYKEDYKGFELRLWSLNKPVRFELINKADPNNIIEIEFEGGQKEEVGEGTFNV